MNRSGPVIVIEDDADDREVLKEVFAKLKYPNEVLFFPDGEDALDYLNASDDIPFLILSDINMPKLSGFELRDKVRMDAKLQVKCIPYLFFSTAANQQAVVDAYSLSAQGFFKKDNSFAEIEKTIQIIMDYWMRCIAPKNF
ncbi:MAG TPA: response regulator [Flavobacterium sp.]|jgi:CheY-like chemotaxis protein